MVRANIMDLKKGDVVYVPVDFTIGFRKFRYPKYIAGMVEGTSPRNLRVVVNGYDYDIFQTFYLEDEELHFRNQIVNALERVLDSLEIINRMKFHHPAEDFDDIALLQLSKHLTAAASVISLEQVNKKTA